MIHYFRFMHLLASTRRDERGASAVEYGLLVAGIAAVIVVIVALLGTQVTDAFQRTCNAIAKGTCAP